MVGGSIDCGAMELEVRLVGGLESCFVSLPLPLIHVLQSTTGGILPPILALELHSCDGASWRLAWSGSASRSPAIEVSKSFGECIALSDGTAVQVKVVPNLPRAVFVTVEPSDESDWEILELNSEAAEEAILKQVGVVHEGMKFPLWLQGHTVVVLQVTSVYPENSVVQLVPGTELAVAPKRRKSKMDSFQDINVSSHTKEHTKSKALLRVQAEKQRISSKFELQDFDLQVVLTCAAFIHPETAQSMSFDNLQLVKIFPRFSVDGDRDSKTRGGSYPSVASSGIQDAGPGSAIINLLFSFSVAKGHLMLPESLRLFLKADVCSWIYVRGYATDAKRVSPIVTLCPCRFKFTELFKSSENNSTLMPANFKNTKNTKLSKDALSDIVDWSVHEELITSISHGLTNNSSQVLISKPDEMRYLICTWIIGQLKAIASHFGEMNVIKSLVLSNETLFHFELVGSDSDDRSRRYLVKGISPLELFYLLKSSSDESSLGGLQETFELSVNSGAYESISPMDLQPTLHKLELGEPVSLYTIKEPSSARNFSCTVSSLSWMEKPISQLIERLTVLLSSCSQNLLETFHLPLPGNVLIHGPPGSGKTSLTTAIANYFEKHEEILAYIVSVSCSRLSLEKDQTIQHKLRAHISEALSHAPSLVIFDDLDFLFSSNELEGSQPSSATIPLTEFLTDILDEYVEKGQSVCGLGPIAFVGSAQSISKLPQSFCSSGRFDFHIQLPAPAVSERGAILKHELHKRSMECNEDIISSVSSKCDGYDAYDLEILVDRAVHAASGRFLRSDFVSQGGEIQSLIENDFEKAMNDFVPVAMRGLSKPASEGGSSGWADVGGLGDVQKAIQEMIEFPSKFPKIFAQAPLRLRSNILLYGPPGCGKTHMVGAAAAACSLRFISIKGPELLNKYIGASEQAVRDLFAKATAAAPCLLFFDEFDSIAPQRGHDNTGVTDRVVNQLLTELDGVETLTGVFVFAATSRPDLLDAALLRPGRLDRLLFCGFPSWHERLDILKVLSLKLPLANDVSLEAIASLTEGFSGADLQALLSDAQLASVHEILDKIDAAKTNQMPVIGDELLKNVALKARPSISETEKLRLGLIYTNFLDSKKSMTSQSRDAKGKRATLA